MNMERDERIAQQLLRLTEAGKLSWVCSLSGVIWETRLPSGRAILLTFKPLLAIHEIEVEVYIDGQRMEVFAPEPDTVRALHKAIVGISDDVALKRLERELGALEGRVGDMTPNGGEPPGGITIMPGEAVGLTVPLADMGGEPG